MNCKNFIFVFLLATSYCVIASDSDQLKKSGLVVLGTYTALSLLDTIFPMKSSHCSQTFTCLGGVATLATLIINNDAAAVVTTAGLIGCNIYSRSQVQKSILGLEK